MILIDYSQLAIANLVIALKQEGNLPTPELARYMILNSIRGYVHQHKEEYGPLVKRTEIVQKTQWLTKFGGVVLYSGLPIILATGNFGFIKVCLFLVLASVLVGVFIHLITLDVELDASFKRAMPILKEKIPEEYHAQCQNILRAAAFTYVIGALTSFLSLRYVWLLLTRLR